MPASDGPLATDDYLPAKEGGGARFVTLGLICSNTVLLLVVRRVLRTSSFPFITFWACILLHRSTRSAIIIAIFWIHKTRKSFLTELFWRITFYRAATLHQKSTWNIDAAQENFRGRTRSGYDLALGLACYLYWRLQRCHTRNTIWEICSFWDLLITEISCLIEKFLGMGVIPLHVFALVYPSLSLWNLQLTK